MGKSRKKSASKVDSAPAVAAPPTKPMKKGKRDVEQVVEKQVVSSKKQKIVNGGVEQAVEKKKVDRKTRKKTKKEKTVSSEECRSSESEEEQNKEQLESKEAASLMQEPTADAKDGATTVSKNDPSDDSHSEDRKESSKGDTKEENSNVDSQPKNFPSGVVENGSVMTPVEEGKSKSSEDTGSEGSGSGEEQVEVTPAKTSSAATTQDEKKTSGSNEESEDIDDSSKEEDNQHLEPPKKSDTDVEMVDAASLKEKPQTPILSQATGSKTVFVGNLSFSIEEDDVRNFFKDAGKIVAVRFAMREDRFAGYGHVEFSTAEAAQEALKRHNEVLLDRRVRLDLARERNAHPATAPQATGSKTVYLGNLSFSIEEDNVKNFFKDVGEVAEVRFAMKDDRFMGFGHVEFTTAQAAQEALKLNNEVLLDRPVKLDLAKERGAYTPASSKEKSYQKGGQAQAKTVFVRGFDISDGFDNVRSKLEKYFGNCGEISRMSIPKDYESGAPKGVAFIDFADSNGFSQALELNGSDVGGRVITVEEAKPRSDSREGSGHGGGRGFGGGRSGGGGRFSGGRGGRGGRGRGPSRS